MLYFYLFLSNVLATHFWLQLSVLQHDRHMLGGRSLLGRKLPDSSKRAAAG